jgi:ArsR family transcriptional regulator, lead/cadmium/zinc/bismuth-responsive transcriptional repressor
MTKPADTGAQGFDPKAISRARKLLVKEKDTIPRLAELYKLLANPARLKILMSLSKIERMCVGDLAQVLDLSIAATSHQLKMLRDRGWLRAEGDGKLVYYSLISDGLKEALEGDLQLLKRTSN